MIGFILAAGLGTRLRPLTENVPKALISVCGMPLLERNTVFFKNQGINTIGVNVHYLPQQIYAFQEKTSVKFDIFHEKSNIRGTGGALYFAQDYLGSDEMFCIANADIISNVSIQKIVDTFKKSDCLCALIAAPPANKGTILYDPESKEYLGPQTGNKQSHQTAGSDFIGMALYKKKVLRFVNKDDFSVLPIWERIQNNGYSVKVFVQHDIFWRDVGTPFSLAKTHFDLLDRTITLNTPSDITIDYKKKIAYPRTLSPNGIESLGRYTWTDSETISEKAALKKCIVYSSAEIKTGESLSNQIITKWGRLPFDS